MTDSTTSTIKHQIKHRWNGSVLFECDLPGDTPRGMVVRLALEKATTERANLRDANLSGANLRDANLRGANLSGALDGVPAIKNIHQAVYAAASKEGALDMSTWHTCGTTHCRGGWVVTLAGEAGKAMEWCLGTGAAAALIYLKSDPKLEKIPDWLASDEDALADMKRLAEMEAKRVQP